MSTAWIHMQTSAVENLTNPCLPNGFSKFSALAGVFALFGMLLTHLIQVIANQVLSGIVKEEVVQQEENEPHPHDSNSQDLLHDHHHGKDEKAQEGSLAASPSAEAHSPTKRPASRRSMDQSTETTHPTVHIPDVQVLVVGESSIQDDSCVKEHPHEDKLDSGHDHSHGGAITHSNHIAAYLLEIGIASHSILIGIALGAARGEFQTLLIALVFHQFFEGVALSSVITEADFKKKTVAVFMVIFYTLTTPLGIVIGILVHEAYDSNAVSLLVAQGILDALAAGILIYDGLVNIILPHFNGKNFRHSGPWKQSVHFGILWLGASLMAVIGIWA